MIRAKEIKSAFIKVLRKSCPDVKKIYSNAVKEGYITPSFFVRIIPLVFRKRQTTSILKSSYMVETTLMQTKKDESMQFEVAEKIRDELGDYLIVNDRKIMVIDPEVQFTGQEGNILQFVFQIEFFEDIREIENEMMKDVKIKEELKHGNA